MAEEREVEGSPANLERANFERPNLERPNRGGHQLIPRPPGLRPGGPPPWADLDAAARHFTLSEVRERLAVLPPPMPSELFDATSRAAAVLVPIYEDDGEARVILTKRPDTMTSHRGEIAFPGGKRDPGDVSLDAAALREAQEEIGLPPADVELGGELDSLSTVASQFTITPFVGLLSAVPELVPNPREVEAAFAVPISELLHPDAYWEEQWELWGDWRSMVFFVLPGETVWGATARILARLLGFLTAHRV
ncbi:MAG TPA: CoA pyrophosphatase [Acidimicrobiia bacterium]|jgi:8-oxo-dGTP pyrophosphatase MutT (NUDIX family)